MLISPEKTSSESKDADRSSSAQLTERQAEILMLICEGLSTSRIADKLGISNKTVEFHKGRMCKQLVVRGSIGMVRWAIRNGLIDP